MRIFRKMAAAISSALFIAVLSVNVSAEKVVGFDYAPAGDDFVYYDFTADDGATGMLTFTKDGDGNLLFSSYEIKSPVPKSPEDFPDCGYPEFFDEQDFYDYVDGLSENDGGSLNYTGIIAKFNVDFDPPLSDGTFSMEGGKYYIVNFETMTVSYVGAYCEYTATLSGEEEEEYATAYCQCTAEDGIEFGLFFDHTENGGLEYMGWETEEYVSEVDYAYSTDENSRVIVSSIVVGEVDTGRPLYSDPDMIPLAANEVLAEVEVVQYVEDEAGQAAARLNIKKYYVITVDGMNSTVHYAGFSYEAVNMYPDFEPSADSNWLDGETTSPNTGNSDGYLSAMLAAAALAVLAKCTKK